MDRFVALENIKHYRLLLQQVTDRAEREKLLELLAEEEAKLKQAEAKRKSKPAEE